MLCIGGGAGGPRIGDISLAKVSLIVRPDVQIDGLGGSRV